MWKLLSYSFFDAQSDSPFKYNFTFQFTFNEDISNEKTMHENMCTYIQKYLPRIIKNKPVEGTTDQFILMDHDSTEVGLLRVTTINDYTSKKIVCQIKSLDDRV